MKYLGFQQQKLLYLFAYGKYRTNEAISVLKPPTPKK